MERLMIIKSYSYVDNGCNTAWEAKILLNDNGFFEGIDLENNNYVAGFFDISNEIIKLSYVCKGYMDKICTTNYTVIREDKNRFLGELVTVQGRIMLCTIYFSNYELVEPIDEIIELEKEEISVKTNECKENLLGRGKLLTMHNPFNRNEY